MSFLYYNSETHESLMHVTHKISIFSHKSLVLPCFFLGLQIKHEYDINDFIFPRNIIKMLKQKEKEKLIKLAGVIYSIYHFDYSLKGIRAISIYVTFNRFSCIQTDHLKDFLLFIWILTETSIASYLLYILPHIVLIYKSSSIEHW